MHLRPAVAAALILPTVAALAAGCTSGSSGPAAHHHNHHTSRPARTSTTPPAVRSTPGSRRNGGNGTTVRGVSVVIPETQVSQPSAPLADPLPKRPTDIARFAVGASRYVVDVWARVVTRRCAQAGVGPAAAYLRAHPCASLVRTLATSRVHGRAVGFGEQTVTLRSARAVQRLRPMIRRGPGLIDTLFSDGYGLPVGPQTVPNLQFAIAARGRTLTTIYYWYINQGTPFEDPVLAKFARDMYHGFDAGR